MRLLLTLLPQTQPQRRSLVTPSLQLPQHLLQQLTQQLLPQLQLHKALVKLSLRVQQLLLLQQQLLRQTQE